MSLCVSSCHLRKHASMCVGGLTTVLHQDHLRQASAGVQVSYAEDDSPQLSEDDDAGGGEAEDDGDEYLTRAALGLRTKPRKARTW